MTISVVFSRGLSGLDAPLVTVETHLSGGLPQFNIVGLAETEVRESRERVRAALQNSGFAFPMRRITVNLAPADLRKESGRFDLAIAIGILAASSQIPTEQLPYLEFAGELAFTGEIRPIRGALAMTYKAHKDNRGFILPNESALEASLVKEAKIFPATHLIDVYKHLVEIETLKPFERSDIDNLLYNNYDDISLDLSDIRGQKQAKRALEISAAGRHSLLMVGPPGTGKSMLASRLPTILPPMTEEEALDSARIYSLKRNEFKLENWRKRPFRNPHHTSSGVALVGGGSIPRPGEISLAHHGVLFLDELAEFDRDSLEVLREPLETGKITISRATEQAEFPAQFQLVAAMNPCNCGYLGHPTRACVCTESQLNRYRNRLSGPFLDRIDIKLEVPALSEEDLVRRDNSSQPQSETSQIVRERVSIAYELQIQRQGKANAYLNVKEIDAFCQPNENSYALLESAINKLNLSARSYHRILKVARTIADLEKCEAIKQSHIAEAIQYHRYQMNQQN